MSAQPWLELDVGEAMAVDWTEREYFTDRTALSRSDLTRLAECPSDFEHSFERGLPFPSRDGSAAKHLGTSAHLAILQPEEWKRRAGIPKIPRPKHCKRGTTVHAAWTAAVERREELMATIPDPLHLTVEEYAKTSQIATAVWSHGDAAVLLGAPGPVEQTVLWREPTSGLLVKVRVDKLSELEPAMVYGTSLEPGLAVADLKTSKSLSARSFARSVRDYGYDLQSSLYRDAVRAWRGVDPASYWIAVANTPTRAGRHLVRVFARSDESHLAGRARYQHLLAEVKRRREHNNWRFDWETGVSLLPEWND
jgi:hypothetical protein